MSVGSNGRPGAIFNAARILGDNLARLVRISWIALGAGLLATWAVLKLLLRAANNKLRWAFTFPERHTLLFKRLGWWTNLLGRLGVVIALASLWFRVFDPFQDVSPLQATLSNDGRTLVVLNSANEAILTIRSASQISWVLGDFNVDLGKDLIVGFHSDPNNLEHRAGEVWVFDERWKWISGRKLQGRRLFHTDLGCGDPRGSSTLGVEKILLNDFDHTSRGNEIAVLANHGLEHAPSCLTIWDASGRQLREPVRNGLRWHNMLQLRTVVDNWPLPESYSETAVVVSGWGFDPPTQSGKIHPGVAYPEADLPVPTPSVLPESHWGIAMYRFDNPTPRLVWFLRSAEQKTVLALASVEDRDQDKIDEFVHFRLPATNTVYTIDRISTYPPCIRVSDSQWNGSLFEVSTGVDTPAASVRLCKSP